MALLVGLSHTILLGILRTSLMLLIVKVTTFNRSSKLSPREMLIHSKRRLRGKWVSTWSLLNPKDSLDGGYVDVHEIGASLCVEVRIAFPWSVFYLIKLNDGQIRVLERTTAKAPGITHQVCMHELPSLCKSLCISLFRLYDRIGISFYPEA